MTASLGTRYYKTLANLLDGFVLRSHARMARRHQQILSPRLPNAAILVENTLAEIFPAPMPLDYIRGDRWEKRSRLWRRDFTFPSSIPTAYENNRHAIVQTYAPDRGLHYPAVIVLHGLMTPTLIAHRPFFRAIVEAGASAYALELPYHFRRTPSGFVSGELFFTADLETSLAAIHQTVAEVRQLIHYLREAGAPVVGLLGFSLGAWMSALVASCEPEVDFALFAMPPSHINHLIWNAPLGESLRQQFETAEWNFATTAPVYREIDPLHLVLLVPPERREVFAAEFDRFVPLHYTQKLQLAWQQPFLRLYPSGHIGLLWSRKFLQDLRRIIPQQLALGRRRGTPVTVVTEEEVGAVSQNLQDISILSTKAAPHFTAKS